MTGITTFASHVILNNILGRETLVIPNNWFVGLSTTPLGVNAINITEPTDPAYQRMALPNDKITFSMAANRLLSIIREVVHPMTTANWPTVNHFFISDASVGGNVWFYGTLSESLLVQIDTRPIIRPNTNQILFDICGGSTSDLAITTSFSNALLNHMFGRSPTFTPPANYFMGVSSTPISAEGVGFTEPTGGGYARLQLPNDKNTFTMAANRAVTLADEFRFPISLTAWGNMTHYFITDGATNNNVFWSGRLVHSRNVTTSTTLAILPDGFRWVLDTCVPISP